MSEISSFEIKLNDAQIRVALVERLKRLQPRAIMEELRVHNGNAIADVVALHAEAHCYEIKGITDKIERLEIQGSYFNLVFRKITIVTTKNHLLKALKLAPDSWGVMLAVVQEGKIVFRRIRAAKINRDFNKEAAVQTLWKSEMLEVLNENKHKGRSREFLAKLLSDANRKDQMSNTICSMLINRSRLLISAEVDSCGVGDVRDY